MRIKKLEYTNYRGLGSGEITFEPGMTVIVGKNGSGKTSILNAVAVFLSWIKARLISEKGQGIYIDENSISNGHNNALIKASFDCIENISITNKTKPGLNKKYSTELDKVKEYVQTKRKEFEDTNFRTPIPVFAFYGVKRAVIDIPLRASNSNYNLLDAYDDCLNGASNFREFFVWFRNQEDLENEAKARDYFRNNNFQIRELEALRKALSIFMPDYSNIQIHRHPLRMQVKKNGKILNIAQLSDGEKIYLALIGDLCRRLCIANPEGDPLQGEGIVLIDEIDLHLHPQWQGEIASRLKQTFPNIQFIVSTHSPQVINRIKKESLRIIDAGDIAPAQFSYGIPSQIILKDIMDLKHDSPEEIDNLIDNIYSAADKSSLDELKKLIDELYTIVPEHPELPRMRKILERLDRRNNS